MNSISCLYINTDTNTRSGLFKSQVLSLKDYVPANMSLDLVNVCNPNSWSQRPKEMPNVLGFPMRFANSILGIFILSICSFFSALQIVVRFKDKEVFIARGYYGGLMGISLVLFGKNFIWDPRSVYPLEMLGKGFFAKGSLPYKFWLFVEKTLAKKATAIFVVSDGHKKYMSRMYKMYERSDVSNRLKVIPCYASSDYSRISDVDLKGFVNKSDQAQAIVCYAGSLDDGWNNIAIYSKLFEQVLSSGNKLLVMTQSLSREELVGFLNVKDAELLEKSLYVTQVNDTLEQMAVLRCCDYGIMYMPRVPDWFTRLSVKFAMYRCAGLPVIINKYFGGAISILRRQEDRISQCIDEEAMEIGSVGVLSDSTRQEISEQSKFLFSQDNFFKAINDVFQNIYVRP